MDVRRCLVLYRENHGYEAAAGRSRDSGLFSGFDAQKKTYSRATWNYAGSGVAGGKDAAQGSPLGGAAHPPSGGAPPPPFLPEQVPWNLRDLRYAAVLVHPITALLTIALFMLRVYMSVFAERGAFGSMIHGDVSENSAKRYHPGWYQEVVRASGAHK